MKDFKDLNLTVKTRKDGFFVYTGVKNIRIVGDYLIIDKENKEESVCFKLSCIKESNVHKVEVI